MTGLEAALDYLRRLLAHHAAEGLDERSLWVLPTTTRSLELVAYLTPSIAPAVVAPLLGERSGLRAFADRLPAARTAISFSDQLTSPLEAPWQVESMRRRMFLSRVEFIAQAELGFRLSVWTANGFVTLPLAADEISVGRAMTRYLASCEQLGSEWLASASQCDRSPDVRIAQWTKRMQLLRSAILASSMGSGLTPSARDALQRGDAIRRALSQPEAIA